MRRTRLGAIVAIVASVVAPLAAPGEVPDDGEEEAATEQGLDQALHASEAEALQVEQAQLQEALLKSKADVAVGSTPGTMTFVILQNCGAC